MDAVLTFEGDVFETEDQRNWTDASYKTYSRPLEQPFPYFVNKGDSIEQKVSLKLTTAKNLKQQFIGTVLPGAELKFPFPRIGYCRPKGSKQLPGMAIELFKRILVGLA